MGLTNAQIINQACLVAKCPGYQQLAGQIYNAVLTQLAQTQDFDVMKVNDFSITANSTENFGAGPYELPDNYLRHAFREVNFQVSGVPYILNEIPIAQWRGQYLATASQSLPTNFATVFSPSKQAYLWPPPNSAYVITWCYYKSHTDIANPETSDAEPWMQDTLWMIKKIAYELMMITDDTRAEAFGRDCADVLRKYIEMKEDKEGFPFTVALGNSFQGNWGATPITKNVGW